MKQAGIAGSILLLISVVVAGSIPLRLVNADITAVLEQGIAGNSMRELTIGKVEWHLFPLGIELFDISVKSAERPLLQAERIWLSPYIMPMISVLSPRIVIHTAKVSSAIIQVDFDDSGNVNWLPRTAADDAPRPPAFIDDVDAPVTDDSSFAFPYPETIELPDATIDISLGETTWQLQARHLAFGSLLPSGSASLELRGSLVMPEQLPINVQLDGNFTMDERVFEMKKAQILLGDPPLSHELDLKTERTPAGTLQADLALDGLLAADLSFEMRESNTGPELSGNITMNTPDVRAIVESLVLSIPESISSIAARALFRTAGDQIFVQIQDASVNDQNFTGEISFRSGSIVSTLTAGNLDLSAWFPEIARSGKTIGKPYPGRLLATEILRGREWQLNIRIGEVLLRGEKLTGVAFSGRSDGDYIRTNLDIDRLWGGSTNVQSSIDLTGNSPVWRVAPSMPILKTSTFIEWLNLPVSMQGPIEIRGNLQSTGNSIRILAESARGSLRIRGTGGGVNIDGLRPMLADVGVLSGNPDLGSDWPARRGYIQLTGQLDLMSGIDSHTLRIAFDNLEFRAQGSMNPFQGELRYDASFAVRDDLSEYLPLEYPPALLNLRWPVRCEGAWADELPCRLDTQGVRETLQRAAESPRASNRY